MRKTGTVAAVIAAAGLTGCGIGVWFVRGEAAEVIEVARAQLCGSEAGVRVLDSAESVSEWLQSSGIPLRLDDPLDPGRYALIEMGQRSTGGHGLAVSREARQSGVVLKIYATFFSPAPGAMATQMITSPCALVRLPDTEFSVIEIYDQSGVRRISSAVSGEAR
ncbi:MAG: protease complex subunit PrcB family protein [Sinimarinibacterium sp.]